MKRVLFVIAGTALGLLIFIGFALFGTGGYMYLTDPRPEAGTPACETAQEAIFKREPDHSKTPAEFLDEVNAACK